MKRACEYFFWRDFPEVLEDMFDGAERITLIEESPYAFSVNVYNEDMDFVNYSMDDIAERWYRIDDMETVREMHCDNNGIWVIYEREVSI